MINSDYLILDAIFYPPCLSELCGDRSLAIATATPEARYLRETEEHKHDGYLLFLPLHSDKRLKIAGKIESVRAYDLAIVPPNVEHNVMQVKGSPAYLALHMSKDILEGTYACYGKSENILKEFSVFSGDHSELFNLAYRFMLENRNNFPGKESIKSALALQMVHAVIRKLTCMETLSGTLPTDHLGLRRVLIFLEANLQKQLSVEQIAREANMSVSTLTRWFRKELDTTPVDYLLRARLSKAKRLLRNGKQSVSDIALSCGFGSVAYFSTRFKKQFGCSPSVFRKERKRN